MNRTVNIKAVLIILGTLVVFGTAVHFVHGFHLERNSRELLELANQAERDGQANQAAQYLGEYLGMSPNDVDAQCKYALLLKSTAKTSRQKLRAYYVLENVLRTYANRDDVRRAAAELGLQFGRFEDSRKYLDALYKSSPKDSDLALLLGRCEFGAGNFDKATRWFVLAADLAPQRIPVSVEAAAYLRSKRLDRPSIANEVMDGLAQRGQPKNEAHEAVARYYSLFGELPKAEQQVKAALATTPTPSLDLLLLAGDIYQRLNQIAEARQHLERGLTLFPKESRLTQRLAKLDLIDGKQEQAKARMEVVTPQVAARPEEIFSAAETLIELGDFDRAREQIAKLDAARASGPAHLLRGRLFMKKSAWGQARVEMEHARSKNPAPELARVLNLWLGQCYEQLGCMDQAQAAYRQAVTLDPTWQVARQALAASLAATGQTERAIEEYRSLAAQQPEFRIPLARQLLTRVTQKPKSEQDFREVNDLLQTFDNDKPSSNLSMLKADCLVEQGKLDEAKKLLEAARERDPKNIGLWLAMANVAQRAGSPQARFAVLDEAEKTVGPSVEWDLVRARHWRRVAGQEGVGQIRKLESRAESYSKADGARLLSELAESFKVMGDSANAQRIYRVLAERSPDDLLSRFALFEIELQTASNSELQKQLDELRRIEGPNGPLASYVEATWCLFRASRGDAAARNAANIPLAKAAELSPTWSRVLTLQATALDLDGRGDKAADKFLEAIDRGDGRIGTIRRALQLLYQQRRYSEANALVRKVSIHTSLASIGVDRIAAQIWAESPSDEGGDPKAVRLRAFNLAKQSIKPDSKDYREFMWLGQLATLAEQPAEAEKALRHAMRLEPASTDVWVTLITLLAKSDKGKAESELQAARKTLPPAQMPIILAPCYEAIGKTKEADELYQAVLSLRPNDPTIIKSAAAFFAATGQSEKALPLLRKLIEPAGHSNEQIRSWARRTLALTIAASGDYQKHKEALALMEANGTTATQDRLARAVILAMQPSNRRDAIRLFEEMANQFESLHPDVRFIAAQLYESEGNWPKAKAYLQGLIQENDKNLTILSHFVRASLRHDEIAEAAQLMNRMTALRPDSFETAQLQCRVLKAQGKPNSEVAEPARKFARMKNVRQDLAAALLDEFGTAAETEAYLRKFAETSQQPEAKLLLAGFLARQRRLPEALAICEKAWATCPAETVASYCVGSLRIADGDAAQYRQVEAWMTAAIEKNPRSNSLPVIMGMMLEASSRPDDAVKWYRRALAQDPNNGLAMNNLACQLALSGNQDKAAEALDLINRAIELVGPANELLDSRSLVYLQLGQPGPALRDIQQAIVQSAEASKTLNFRLAQAQLANKNRGDAVAAIRRAKDLGLQVTDLAIAERDGFKKLMAELD